MGYGATVIETRNSMESMIVDLIKQGKSYKEIKDVVSGQFGHCGPREIAAVKRKHGFPMKAKPRPGKSKRKPLEKAIKSLIAVMKDAGYTSLLVKSNGDVTGERTTTKRLSIET